MIVDYHGAIQCRADYGGETVTAAVIDIESLRRRRLERRHNWVTQLRTEVYHKMYELTIYPRNLFLQRELTALGGRERLAEQPIAHFIETGIWKAPT